MNNINRSKIKLFAENDIVLREGEITGEMYRIVSGQAIMYFDYGKESEYLIGALGEGRCFGEIGLLTGRESPFTVIANSDLMLLGIDSEDFSDFIIEEPEKAADIMRDLARIVVTMSANINMLKEELVSALKENSDTKRLETINRNMLKYRISGIQGSPYLNING